MKKIYSIDEINTLDIKIDKPSIIFLQGDLGAGKTTLSKHILQHIFGIQEEITSPTYTYYNRYGENYYHFDLYRIGDYDEFFAIGGEDILDNLEGVALIEWPDKISQYYSPDVEINLLKTQDENTREIEIIYHK